MSKFEALAATVRSAATRGRKPKDIIADVRKRHPEASKKDVVRAAFYALTVDPAISPEPEASLYDFALSQRRQSNNDTD